MFNKQQTDDSKEKNVTDSEAARVTEPEAAPLSEAPAAPPTIEQQLEIAQQKALEAQDAFLRAKAEGDNIRKRAQTDIASAHKYAVENFAERLVPVMDSLQAALAVENATAENFKAGVELTLKQLADVFAKANLVELNPVGEKFDPHRHQAITMVPTDGEPNQVVTVMQKGYLLHDRVVRPALVTVSKAKDV